VTRFRIFTLIVAGVALLCLLGVRPTQTQSTLRRITNTTEEGINLNASISGDGRIVAFESTEDIAGAGGADHFRAIRANIAVDPPTFSQMGGTRALASAISQDGSRIAFASKDDPLGIIGDTLDEPNETFFVNLSNATNEVIVDNQGQGTINDNDPTPSLSINDVPVAEGDSGTTPATFTVTLSAASGQTVTVNYATADNTAAAGSDYQSTSGALTFNPGETAKPLTVLVNADITFEHNETFFVNLTSPTNATITDNQGQGTITNDDPAPPTPTLVINDISIAEGNSGTSTATFNVTLSPSSSQAVTVDFATANGTATTAGNDYQSATGTLTFNPGDTSGPINVTINGDTPVEPDETFFVNLTNATNGAAIGDAQGLATIQNDGNNILD
jgi:hypothetical protein